MKINSLLSYTVAVAVVTSVASFLILQDALLGCTVLASAMATVFALHEYKPRSYFSITSAPAASLSPHPLKVHVSRRITPHRRSIKVPATCVA